MIITIDGKVATGKSTVAKKVADSLGFIYFDTGAMYRAITYAIMRDQVDFHDPQTLKQYLASVSFDIKLYRGEKNYYINHEDVTNQIRKPEVTEKVSEVSAIPAVREKLVSIQRELGKNVNAVFEGRDMGTIVFPNADLKIFLTGSPTVRAQRRYDDLIQRFPELKDTLTVEKVLEEINHRDEYDSNRQISPLKQADDAHLVDTTGMNAGEVAMSILELRDKIKTPEV